MQERTDEVGNTILYHLVKDIDVLTDTEVAMRDGLVDVLRSAGVEVINDEAEGQKVLDEVNRAESQADIRTQKILGSLNDAVDFIRNGLKQRRGGQTEIFVPEWVNRRVKSILKHDVKKHLIDISGLNHAYNNHGEGGKKLQEDSIPLTKEDFELVPYIIANPDRIEPGSDNNGINSVRYIKNVSNGKIVYVEAEYNLEGDILVSKNMWADMNPHALSPSTVVDARSENAPKLTSNNVIRSNDAAKIRKDAETAIENEGKIQEMRVWHGSASEFDEFDHSHMGEGEGAHAYGWGTYLTQVEGIGRNYAIAIGKKNPDYYWKGQKIDRGSINPLGMAYDVVEREGTIKKAIRLVEKFLDNPDAHEGWVEVRNILMQSRKSDFYRRPSRYLYEVEIPDNDGTNYLSWDKTLPKEQRRKIAKVVRTLPEELLKRENYGPNWLPGGFEQLAKRIENSQFAAQEIVTGLTNATFSKKVASDVLSRAGFVGIEYPAQWRSGGRRDGAKNYVIFNEGDMKITNRTQFFKTESGEVYGFVKDGKIYLDPKVASAETPIHEYCHLWTDALKRANPEAWERLKETMLGEKDVLEHVKRLYPELEGDELLGEVFSHYSGKRGAERLRADMESDEHNRFNNAILEWIRAQSWSEKFITALQDAHLPEKWASETMAFTLWVIK